MRVLFINPNHNWNSVAKAYGSKSFLLVRKITPPLGLGYLAAIIEKNHTAKIIDANALDLSYEQVSKQILEFKPEVTAFTSMYPSTEFVIKYAKKIKNICGTMVIGGADPTVRVNDYLEVFDYVNCGQGEISFEKFIAGQDPETITGFCYKDKKTGEVVCNGSGKMVEDLDDLPMTPWHLLPRNKYRPAVMNIKYDYPSIVIMTSRGCPHHCSYCAIHTVVPALKFRSIDNVLSEIDYCVEHYGIKHVEFFDDTFTFHKDRVIELCNKLLERNYKIKWCCVTRPDCIDQEMLRIMKKAGCYFILYGVQTVSENVLEKINRRVYKDKVAETIKLTKDAGIMVRLDFILGLPGSTVETMLKSFEFVKKVEPDIMDFYPVLWLPATQLTNKFKPEYEDEYLEKIASDFYKKFYFRPGYIIRVLKNSNRLIYIYRYFICFYALLIGFITKKIGKYIDFNEKY